MLILTRRPGERVVIGEGVTVTVMEVAGQTVRLGIDAPKGLPVYREEIWLAVKAENMAAAESSAQALVPPPAGAAALASAGNSGGAIAAGAESSAGAEPASRESATGADPPGRAGDPAGAPRDSAA